MDLLLHSYNIPKVQLPNDPSPPYLGVHLQKFKELLVKPQGFDSKDATYGRSSAWHFAYDNNNAAMNFHTSQCIAFITAHESISST